MRTSLYISNSKCVFIQGYTLSYLLSHCMIWRNKILNHPLSHLKFYFTKWKFLFQVMSTVLIIRMKAWEYKSFCIDFEIFQKYVMLSYGCSCVYLTAKTRLWLSKFPTLLPLFIYCWKNVNINAAVKFQENINTNQVFQCKCGFIFINVSLFIQKMGT